MEQPGASGWLLTTPLLQVVNGIEVYSTKITCKVTSRFAHNVVTTRAVNHADTAKEVSFNVELPKTAFITNFTLWVSPQLLALGSGGEAGPAKAPQLCLPTGPSMALRTQIALPGWLIPQHGGVRADAGWGSSGILCDTLDPQPKDEFPTRRGDDRQFRAFVWQPLVGGKGHLYLGLVNVQLLFAGEASARLLKGHWPPVSLSPFQIVSGYFVHFFAPQGLPVVPKNVVFVIDISGSMHGRKMEQVLFLVQGLGVMGGKKREIFFKWMKQIFPVKEEEGGQGFFKGTKHLPLLLQKR